MARVKCVVVDGSNADETSHVVWGFGTPGDPTDLNRAPDSTLGTEEAMQITSPRHRMTTGVRRSNNLILWDEKMRLHRTHQIYEVC